MARIGRPPLPAHLKPVELTVRMRPAVYDAAYRVAVVQGISPNALLQRTLERIFTHQTILERFDSCYGALQAPSTLTGLVSGAIHETDVQPPTAFGAQPAPVGSSVQPQC